MVVFLALLGDGVVRWEGPVAERLRVAIRQQRAESLGQTRVSSAGSGLPSGCVVDRQQEG